MKISKNVQACERTVSVKCPFCSTLNKIKVGHGSVETVISCEHFKKIGGRDVETAVFERDAPKSEVHCPYCGTEVEVEHYEEEVLDVEDECEHFERTMEEGDILFSDFERRSV